MTTNTLNLVTGSYIVVFIAALLIWVTAETVHDQRRKRRQRRQDEADVVAEAERILAEDPR